ncbi:uncharacterized protein KY384_000421 [Bacidia gigantensis]|uniref:uncharacterized protein n=1 Tax=Bacidia gigantensis TaxID=2732470 RepID=UPI001D0518B8|nr:uncharacterized protein KY384_000421 [Bacidia gigantensis]KAG8525661.1 hypothetical protein KY384_000421 [Bacidia gigantensis]
MPNFDKYAQDIHLEFHDNGCYLVCLLATGSDWKGSEGNGWNKSTLNLDEKIANTLNENGYADLGYNDQGGFSKTSRNIKLEDNGRRLTAEVKRGDTNEWKPRYTLLYQLIANEFGYLKWGTGGMFG